MYREPNFRRLFGCYPHRREPNFVDDSEPNFNSLPHIRVTPDATASVAPLAADDRLRNRTLYRLYMSLDECRLAIYLTGLLLDVCDPGRM
jgi:hypothetical protein